MTTRTLAQEIEQTLLKNPFNQGNDAFKLLPTQGDRESFLILVRGESDSKDDQITRAYRFFERRLRSTEVTDLEKLKQVIVSQLVLVSIVLDRDDNPHLVFESLNAKGRTLSQSDLIRNYVFMKMHVDEQERLYATYWKPMQDRLGQDLTGFIRHYLMKEGGVVEQSDVCFALKDRADGKSPQEIVAYLEEITHFAEIYARLLHPEREPSSKVNQQMHRLNRIEVTTNYPFLLNVYRDFAAGKLSEDDLADLLDVLENFMVCRFVCSVPTNRLAKIFPPPYAQVSPYPSLVTGLKEALRTKEYPRDAEFRDRFISSKLYGSGDRTEKTKPILERLEESFEHLETVSLDDLTIEHVMPQTLTDSWMVALGGSWEMVHELLLHTAGNLTSRPFF